MTWVQIAESVCLEAAKITPGRAGQGRLPGGDEVLSLVLKDGGRLDGGGLGGKADAVRGLV